MSDKLKITPAPGRIVVRPFDPLSPDSKIILLESASLGKTTTGLVVAVNQKELADALPDDFVPAAPFINIGMQVVFAAFAGTDIHMYEPLPDKPRHQQKYIVLREADVIAAIEFADSPVVEVHAEPRSIGA